MKKIPLNIITLTLIAVFFSTTGFSFILPSVKTFYEARSEYRSGDIHFAVISLREIIYDYPHSRMVTKAQFSLAECYFDMSAYKEAFKQFEDYITVYPKQKDTICAKIYMLKILTLTQPNVKLSEQYTKDVKKELYDKPFFLAYRDYKRRFFKTPFANKLEFREYVDRIEIYRNGQIFYKILP